MPCGDTDYSVTVVLFTWVCPGGHVSKSKFISQLSNCNPSL